MPPLFGQQRGPHVTRAMAVLFKPCVAPGRQKTRDIFMGDSATETKRQQTGEVERPMGGF